MPPTALDHALALAADLHLACFPCGTNKNPTTPNGVYSATTDPAALRALWREHPGPLIGVACGEVSNLALLDIDAKHSSARQWWNTYQQQLSHSRVHRTRNGGLHIFFKHHPEISCTVGRITRGIDTRGAGGYAIWWPAAGLPVLSDAPTAPAPTFLLEQLKPARPPPPPRAVIPDDKRIERLLQYVATAPEGQRNAILFWGASRFREMLGRELSEDDATNLLLQAAYAAGLSQHEAAATVRSGLRGPRS
jgi:hypothetical protein